MENQGPQLLVAQSLVRESQQRHAREQVREHLRVRERPLATRGDRLRLIVAGALVALGTRLAAIDDRRPIVADNPRDAIKHA